MCKDATVLSHEREALRSLIDQARRARVKREDHLVRYDGFGGCEPEPSTPKRDRKHDAVWHVGGKHIAQEALDAEAQERRRETWRRQAERKRLRRREAAEQV